MAASKPTSWLSGEINFLSHLAKFGDLRWRSGLFPSRLVKLSPHGLTASSNSTDYSEFDSCRQLSPPNTNQCSTCQLSMALYLNIFRGEPAISGFDWHFTPTHKSSPSFTALVGSDLLTPFTADSSCSWVDHPVSGLPIITCISHS